MINLKGLEKEVKKKMGMTMIDTNVSASTEQGGRMAKIGVDLVVTSQPTCYALLFVGYMVDLTVRLRTNWFKWN